MTIRRLLFSAIMLFGGAGVAHATLTVQTGNHPQIDDNVISNSSCASLFGGPGLTIQGCLNGSHSTLVDFTSDESIDRAAGGQAKIVSDDGNGYSTLTTSVVGKTFATMILNVEASANGTIDFTDGTTTSALFGISKNGSNFFTITGGPFPFVTFTTFDAAGAPAGIVSGVDLSDIVNDVKQVRLGGIADPIAPSCPTGTTGSFPNCSTVLVPEPTSMLILGSALLGLGVFRRHRSDD